MRYCHLHAASFIYGGNAGMPVQLVEIRMLDRLTKCCGDGLVLQLILAFMLLFTLARGAEAARDISPQRECANCHIAWLAEFNRKDVTTLIPYNPRPVEATGKQDVVSTDRMCFSCHDGFVLDSRFAWQNRQNFHPIGVKPSNKVKIPTVEGKMIFPLNEDGNVYCGTCHSAHGVEWGDKTAAVFMRMRNVDSSMCMSCHLERGTGEGRQEEGQDGQERQAQAAAWSPRARPAERPLR